MFPDPATDPSDAADVVQISDPNDPCVKNCTCASAGDLGAPSLRGDLGDEESSLAREDAELARLRSLVRSSSSAVATTTMGRAVVTGGSGNGTGSAVVTSFSAKAMNTPRALRPHAGFERFRD
ncbi:hypothetical protein MMC28_011637 [Mycoblastus sanguinarius]|nr:hypothetical protein [Mycoblastus sanguinarius]